MSYLKILGTSAAVSAVLIAAERYILTPLLGALAAPTGKLGLAPLYGGVIAVNVVGTAITLQKLGGLVGAARAKYNVKLPKMQAEGDSQDAFKFNCVQRGHQNPLESYTQYLAMALITGTQYPVFATLCGVGWILGRNKWAKIYAEEGPDARYKSPVSMLFIHSLIGVMMGTTLVSLKLLGIL